MMIKCEDCSERIEKRSSRHVLCSVCARERGLKAQKQRNQKYYAVRAEEERQRKRDLYISNPKKAGEPSKRWAERNPDRKFGQHLKRTYGITYEEYSEKLKSQNGVCALCGEPETVLLNGRARRLAVDHNRDTGCVRGLLCTRCNRTRVGLYETAMKDREVKEYLAQYEKSEIC